MTEMIRSLGLVRATALVVGIIVGASIFVQPSAVTGAVGSVEGVLLAWSLAGLLTLAGALITAELASAYPETGGVQAFLREAWGPGVGFLWAWAMFWTMHSGIIAAIAVIFARYTGWFIPLGDVGLRVVAVSAVVAWSVVNVRGVGLGSALQTAVTLAKVGAIAAAITLGFWLGRGLPDHFVGATEGEGLRGLARAVGAGLFAFGGWHMVSYTAEETRNPERTLPRALLLGTLIVTVIYLGLNAAYLYVLPLDQVAASTRVAADAADRVLGAGGGTVMAALVMGSTVGALGGVVLTGPRVYYSLAREGLLFHWLGALHPRYGTPHRAIVLQAAWVSVLIATGTYGALVSRVIYTEWFFFAAMAIGLLLLRRRPAYRPAWRLPGGAAIPLLFAAGAVPVAAAQLIADPRNSGIGLALVLAGWPVYLLIHRRRNHGVPL